MNVLLWGKAIDMHIGELYEKQYLVYVFLSETKGAFTVVENKV